jgi:diguanylate cyclase (GGDEF)-like protein/PAS domain S-box-containing protein
MPVAVIRLGRSGRIDMLNPKAVRLLHDLQIEMVGAEGTAILDALWPGLGAHWTATAGRIGEVVPAQRISPSRPNCPAMHLQVQLVRPDHQSTMLVLEDVTVAVEQERDAMRQRMRLGVVLENMQGYCAAMLDDKGRVAEWNPSIGRMLGIQEAQIVGRPLLDQLVVDDGLLPEPPDFPTVELAVALQGWCRLRAPWRHGEGQTVWGDCIVTPVVEKSGLTSGYVAVIRDVTEERLHTQGLIETALLDPLTGIGNRRGFEQEMQALESRPHGATDPCAAVLVDIDHFKRVNDSYGHDAGDAVLKAVALCLTSTVRDTDILARFGGEEFVLWLPGANAATAETLAERLRLSIAAITVEHQGRVIAVTASFGVAQQIPGESRASVLVRADTALYAAKREGRNRVAVSSQGQGGGGQSGAESNLARFAA